MQTLAIITEQHIHPGAKQIDTTNFTPRQAVRAVLLNKKGEVVLLCATKRNYHKLPGGGIDEGEDTLKALERELLEETGCQAKVVGVLGKILEYRDQWQLFQTSYCYLAQQTGSQQNTALTADEQNDGFEPRWAPSIDAAIALLQSDTPNNYDGKFIQQRDLRFLRAARAVLNM